MRKSVSAGAAVMKGAIEENIGMAMENIITRGASRSAAKVIEESWRNEMAISMAKYQ